MNTDLAARRDELKRDKEATERTIKIQTRSLRNIESELAKIESSPARPEPRYTATPGCVYDKGVFIGRVSDAKHGCWDELLRLANIGSSAIPVTDEAEREFLLDMKAAREVMAEKHYTLVDVLEFDDSLSRLESKRPGAFERLRK